MCAPDLASQKPDGGISTPTSEGGCLIGTERDAINIRRMPRECVSVCARPRVPETDAIIVTTTSEGGA